MCQQAGLGCGTGGQATAVEQLPAQAGAPSPAGGRGVPGFQGQGFQGRGYYPAC